jgi:MFS family permease
MNALLRLYPASWRERHEVEVARMLEDTGAGMSDAPDLIRGAIDAHMHPGPMGLPTGGVRRWVTVDHLAGAVLLTGGLVWFVSFGILALAMLVFGEDGWRDSRPLAVLAVAGPMVALGFSALLLRHAGDRYHKVFVASAVMLAIVGSALLTSAIAGIVLEPRVTFASEGGAHRNPAMILLLVGSMIGAFALGTVPGIPSRWLMLSALGAASMIYALYSVSGFPLPNIHAGFFWIAGGLLFAIAAIGIGRSAMRMSPGAIGGSDATEHPLTA